MDRSICDGKQKFKQVNRLKTVRSYNYKSNNVYYSVITMPLPIVKYSQTVQALQLLPGFPENLEDPEIKK